MNEFDRISALPDILTHDQLEYEFNGIIEKIKSAPESQDSGILMSSLFQLADRQWNTYSILPDVLRHQLDSLILEIWIKDSLDSTTALMGIIARLGLINAFSKVILTNPHELTDEIKTEIASAIVEFGDTVGDPYYGMQHIKNTQSKFMTNSKFLCANCNASLASANAVCPHCEPEFSAPDRHKGKYHCPQCDGRFDQLGICHWPPNAKWCQPQVQKLECLHCRAILRDRTVIQRSRTELVLMPLAIMFSAFSTWRPGTQIILLIIFVATEWLRKRALNRALLAEEDRYVSEKPGE